MHRSMLTRYQAHITIGRVVRLKHGLQSGYREWGAVLGIRECVLYGEIHFDQGYFSLIREFASGIDANAGYDMEDAFQNVVL